MSGQVHCCQRYAPQVVSALVSLFEDPKQAPERKETVKEIAFGFDELRPRMELTRDLITPGGMLMLSSGHKLDAQLIGKIVNFVRVGQADLLVNVRADSVTPKASWVGDFCVCRCSKVMRNVVPAPRLLVSLKFLPAFR